MNTPKELTWRELVEKQRNEIPTEIIRWGEALYPGGYTYCRAPAEYDTHDWGMNKAGEVWMWYFCVTDEFGDLQPVPHDTMWYDDQQDENLSFYWGGKLGLELRKINLTWIQEYGIGSKVVHWDSGVVGVIHAVHNPVYGIPFDAEDLNPNYPDQPQIEVRWENNTDQKLIYPTQCCGIFSLV